MPDALNCSIRHGLLSRHVSDAVSGCHPAQSAVLLVSGDREWGEAWSLSCGMLVLRVCFYLWCCLFFFFFFLFFETLFVICDQLRLCAQMPKSFNFFYFYEMVSGVIYGIA